MNQDQGLVAVATTNNDAIIYAPFWKRLLAVIVDSVILNVVNFIIGFVLGIFGIDIPILNSIISITTTFGYAIIFITSSGQTLGKKLFRIKVQSVDGAPQINVFRVILRETVGKILSAVTILGYLWPIWDKQKQTWHDKIAKTIVVKV